MQGGPTLFELGVITSLGGVWTMNIIKHLFGLVLMVRKYYAAVADFMDNKDAI